MSDVLTIANKVNYFLTKPSYDWRAQAASEEDAEAKRAREALYIPDKPAFAPVKEEKAPPPPPKAFSVNFPRLSLGLEYARVTNIPERLRTVHAYERPEATHRLPRTTHCWPIDYEIGVAMSFLNTVELAWDLIYRDTYTPGFKEYGKTDLSSAEKDISGEYLGYRLHGWGMRFSLLLQVLQVENTRFLLKGGYVNEAGFLSSGTDAWGSFHEQHSVRLPSKIFTGLTLRFGSPPESTDKYGAFGEVDTGFIVPLDNNPAENGAKVLSLGILLSFAAF